MGRISITPAPHIIDSLINEKNVSWHKCFAELIDNSFDAGADRVDIHIHPQSVVVKDNGNGVNADTMLSMVKLGEHTEHKNRQKAVLGRFGIGAKTAMLFLSDRVAIESVRECRVHTSLTMDWAALMQTPDWTIEEPFERPATDLEERGTRITCGPLRKGRTRMQQETLTKLGVTYMPAIADMGKQIVFHLPNNKLVRIIAAKVPTMVKSTQFSFEVNGKRVDGIVGIKQDGIDPQFDNFAICYGHRCIAEMELGTGTYNASRMTGVIRLGNGWKLTTYKDGIDDLEPLRQGVFEHIEPLLKEADQMSRIIECDELLSEVESQLLDIQAKGREARTTGKNPGAGTVKDANTGRRRLFASKVTPLDDGKAQGSAKKTTRAICVDTCDNGGKTIGKVQFEGKTLKIYLDKQHPAVSEALKEKNVQLIKCFTVMLAADHDTQNDENGQRRFLAEGDLIEMVSRSMANISSKGFI